MKNTANQKIVKLLYKQAVEREIYPDELEGESLAIHEMLVEIRELGYPYHHFADIEFRSIKDPEVMNILLEFYPRMESLVTKEHCLRKIDPKKFPVAIELALKEYDKLSPLEKQSFSGLQEVIAKGKTEKTYVTMLLSLVENPDNYASSFLIRERLVKSAPELLKRLTVFYSKGVLLPATLKEFAAYGDPESIAILKKVAEITEEDVKKLHDDRSYTLCVTMYEDWKLCCTVANLQKEAKRLLKKKGWL